MTWWQRRYVGIVMVICVAVLPLAAPTQAATSYKTLLVGHLVEGERYEYSYVYQDEITHHAFTFDAAAGDVLTLATQWITDPPPAGYGDPWQPVLIITPGMPPVGSGEVFVWDWDKDFHDGRFLPKDGNNIEKPTIVDWEVPTTGTYTLYAKFYPYQESSGGTYSIGFTHSASASPSEGWTGEFPQLEGGNRLANGLIDGNPSWAVHSFPANPGDMVTIMAWSYGETEADQLAPQLHLVKGGYDPANADTLASDTSQTTLSVITYTMPDTIPDDTLYTAVLDGGARTIDYGIWMRQWQQADLLAQVGGGLTGELAQTEAGTLSMNGVITNLSAYNVHSFTADPGDVISVTVTAKRDTPTDQVIPMVLLVPGGYTAGEQWLAMDVTEDTTARIPAVTIPGIMPRNTTYTVVVADGSNVDYLLFGGDPVFEYTGGYKVTVSIN
jgi:hypothetical protein